MGAAIMLFSGLWMVLPFVVFGGPAMTKWMTLAEWFRTPAPYVGMFGVVIGLFLIRGSR